MRHEYLIGKVYGLKKIIDLMEDNNNGLMAKVKCVRCGKESVVRARSLYCAKTTSCSCMSMKYGVSQEPRLYAIFSNMRYRCNTETSPAYKNYGGRGIKVCAEWNSADGFRSFMDWSIKNGYNDSMTIDRINPNKDYSPDNCQWISKSENTARANRSKRTQHRKSDSGKYFAIGNDGVMHVFDNASQFARETGLSDNGVRKAAHNGTIYKSYRFGFINNLRPANLNRLSKASKESE